MRAWRQVIEQWAAQKSRIAPLTRQRVEYWMWDISLPSFESWPPHLPNCPALQDFYRRCDGGLFNWFLWWPLVQLAGRNREWVESLKDYYGDGRGDVLFPGRHVVVAEDAGGCPVVWDATTDEVKTFQPDGGDWEPPLATSMEAFLVDIFNPAPAGEQDTDPWYLFLNWLDSQRLPELQC